MYYLLLQARDGEPPPELAKYSQDLQVYNAALLIDDGYVRGEATPGHDGAYINAVLEDLTSRGHDLLEKMEAELNTPAMRADLQSSTLNVFISHSSNDLDVAEALVDLLRLGIGLTEQDIRCTSVDGYRFEVGADTDAQLKLEVKSSKAFIGLITPSSIQSAYVLFELGARWGADLHLAPVLARGADSKSLRGPLAKLNALQATEEPQMHQLVQDIARKLQRVAKSPAVYGKALQKLVAAARIETVPNVSAKSAQVIQPRQRRTPAVTNVVNEAVRLIREGKVQYSLYALQQAGAGNLDSEEEFLEAREALIQHNLPDPIKGISLTTRVIRWLDFIRFANHQRIQLSSQLAAADFMTDYQTMLDSRSQNIQSLRPIDIRNRLDALIRDGETIFARWHHRNDALTSSELREVTLHWLSKVTKFVERSFSIKDVDRLVDYQKNS